MGMTKWAGSQLPQPPALAGIPSLDKRTAALAFHIEFSFTYTRMYACMHSRSVKWDLSPTTMSDRGKSLDHGASVWSCL